MTDLVINKEVVRCFNKEVIKQGNRDSFTQLMNSDFINQTAPPGANSRDGKRNTFLNILRPAFPDLIIEIYK